MVIRRGGIILPKTHPNAVSIENDLNRSSLSFTGELERTKFYIENEDSFIIPRFYPVNGEIIDKSVYGSDIEINSNVVPRNERQKNAINYLIDNENGVLQLEPGSGKTVIAIAMIAKVKKKAIIFAHKTKLLENWKKEILEFTDLQDEDIVKLSSSNYKTAFEKKIILSTPHVVANAVNKNNTDFIDKLQNSGIGIGIIDEVHVGIGPEEFSKSSLSLNCKRVYGLSATPSRSDGNNDIITYHVGEVKYFPPEENEILKPRIYIIKFSFEIFTRHRDYLLWGGKFQISRYFQQMYKSTKYIDTVTSLIRKCYKENRITLILGERKKTLLRLAEKCGVPEEDIGIFIPGTTSKERLSVSTTDDLDCAFFEKKIIFSTYLACRDGNNRKDLDCLVMSTPTSNIQQAIGRIQRQLEGKKTPVVFDIVDTEGPIVWSKDLRKKVPWWMRNYAKRKLQYEKFEWEFKEINLDEKKRGD